MYFKSGKHFRKFFKQRLSFCREGCITTRCLPFFLSKPNGIQTLVPLILVPAIGQQTEHSSALQVAVATGECTQLTFLLSQTRSNSKTYNNSSTEAVPRFAHRTRTGCCGLGFGYLVLSNLQSKTPKKSVYINIKEIYVANNQKL